MFGFATAARWGCWAPIAVIETAAGIGLEGGAGHQGGAGLAYKRL